MALPHFLMGDCNSEEDLELTFGTLAELAQSVFIACSGGDGIRRSNVDGADLLRDQDGKTSGGSQH